MNEAPPLPYLPPPVMPSAPSAVVSAVAELQSSCGSWVPMAGMDSAQYSTQVAVCDVALGRHDAEHASFINGILFGIAFLVVIRVVNVWLLLLYRTAINARATNP